MAFLVPSTEEIDNLNKKLDQIICLITKSIDADARILYTNSQLASKLEVSTKTIQNWRDQGKIAFTKIGRKIFYTQEAVVEFLNKYSLKAFNK